MKRLPILIINTLQQLTFKKFLQLALVVARHPLFAVISLYATIKAYSIAKKYFPKTNSTSGIGNAFRHALWTCLIMMYCSKVSSPRKSAEWCLKITNMHEELFPNLPLQKHMDLHNNKVGLDYFFKILPGIHRQFFEASFFIDALLTKTKSAVLISSIKKHPGENLVYIEE